MTAKLNEDIAERAEDVAELSGTVTELAMGVAKEVALITKAAT